MSIRNIAFNFSSTISYNLEFGDEYIRFYYDKELLLDESGNSVWIQTPYSEEHLDELHIEQIGDVLWIVHPLYPPSKLKRLTPYFFELEEIPFESGPFMTRNDLLDPNNQTPVSMYCNVTEVGKYGVLVATTDVFKKNHDGALFALTHPKAITNASISGSGTSSEVYGKGTFSFKTRGTWSGTIYIQRKQGIADSWSTFRTYKSNDNYNVSLSWTEKENNVFYRIYSVASDVKAELSTEDVYSTGIVKAIAGGSGKSIPVIVIKKLESKNPTIKWAEGSWSQYRGFPSSITFFEQRCCYAGSLSSSESSLSEIPAYPRLYGVP